MVADRFRLRYKLTPGDYKLYSKLAVGRIKSGHRWKIMLGAIVLGLLLAALIILIRTTGLVSHEEFYFVLTGFAFGAFLTIFGYAALQVLLTRNMVGAHDAMIGQFSLAAYEGGGLQITGQHMQSSFDWTAFTDLTQSRELMIIWVDTSVGVLLPNSAFANKEERLEFAAFVTGKIEAQRPAA